MLIRTGLITLSPDPEFYPDTQVTYLYQVGKAQEAIFIIWFVVAGGGFLSYWKDKGSGNNVCTFLRT